MLDGWLEISSYWRAGRQSKQRKWIGRIIRFSWKRTHWLYLCFRFASGSPQTIFGYFSFHNIDLWKWVDRNLAVYFRYILKQTVFYYTEMEYNRQLEQMRGVHFLPVSHSWMDLLLQLPECLLLKMQHAKTITQLGLFLKGPLLPYLAESKTTTKIYICRFPD